MLRGEGIDWPEIGDRFSRPSIYYQKIEGMIDGEFFINQSELINESNWISSTLSSIFFSTG